MFVPTNHAAGSSSSLDLPQPCRQLTLSEIQLATQDFDESLIIGRGGFGKVYKGTIYNGESHLVVAIKRLDSTSNQGAVEFWAEVEMLSKLRHSHLVALIGYCNDRQEMILVYEYMPRGTLENHLHKLPMRLTWVRRLKICIGAARGLDYLHTGTGINHGVIHRDVKSSNILLHDSWAAKVSDFGLSRITPTNQQSTYVNTMVKGTFGYLDPDYFYTGRLTRKSDVYAFGVVLFEVLCGKRAVDRTLDEEQWGLARWAQESIKEGRLKQMVDPYIKGRISPKCLKEFTRLADRCLHSHPKQRPTMAEVVVGLESILALQEKTKNMLQPASMAIFGRMMPTFLFSSNRENPVGGRSLKSLELYLDTLGGENKVLYRFDFATISVATENFSNANNILQHPFRSKYKGTLENGQGILVAPAYSDSECQQYVNEMSLLVQLQHVNLVQLLGYCIGGTTLFIVYEFEPYGGLDLFIFDPSCNLLDWNERYKIIVGVARVLLYLHKDAPIQIIHCDINPSQFLLDKSLDPKLSDVGLARCLAMDESSSRRWNWGYIAPEYLLYGRRSTKSDVFSFGMLILKTISGCKEYDHDNPTTSMNFALYAWTNWVKGTSSSIIDPRFDADSISILRFVHIGLLCVQADESDRPTMEDVIGMLLTSLYLNLPTPRSPLPPFEAEEDLDGTNSQEILLSDNCDTGTVEEFISELHPR